jgi:hypothetical protein
LENTTVAPPEVRSVPAASLACRVSVTCAPETTVGLDTLTRDVAVDAAPGVTVMVGRVEVTGAALIVAPMVVAVPANTLVNVAVYVPSPLSVVPPIVPVLVPPLLPNTTVSPPAVRLLPAESRACSVSVTVPRTPPWTPRR